MKKQVYHDQIEVWRFNHRFRAFQTKQWINYWTHGNAFVCPIKKNSTIHRGQKNRRKKKPEIFSNHNHQHEKPSRANITTKKKSNFQKRGWNSVARWNYFIIKWNSTAVRKKHRLKLEWSQLHHFSMFSKKNCFQYL